MTKTKATITRNIPAGTHDLMVVDSMGRIVAGSTFLSVEAAERAVASLGLNSFTFMTVS